MTQRHSDRFVLQLTYLPGDGGPAHVEQVVLETDPRNTEHGVIINETFQYKDVFDGMTPGLRSLEVSDDEVEIIIRARRIPATPTWLVRVSQDKT